MENYLDSEVGIGYIYILLKITFRTVLDSPIVSPMPETELV